MKEEDTVEDLPSDIREGVTQKELEEVLREFLKNPDTMPYRNNEEEDDGN